MPQFPELGTATAGAPHLPRNLSSTFQRMLEPLPSTDGAIHRQPESPLATPQDASRLPDLAQLTKPSTALTTRASLATAPADLPNIKSFVASKPLAVMGTEHADSHTVAQTAKTRMMGMFRSTLLSAFATANKDLQISSKQAYVLGAFTDLTRRVLEIDHAVKSYQYYGSTDETKNADAVSIGPIHGNFLFDTIIQIWTVPACAGAVGEWDSFYHLKVKRLRESFAATMNNKATCVSFSQLVTYMEDFSAQLQATIGGFIKEANKFVGRHTPQAQRSFSLFDAHDGWLRKLMAALPQSDSQFNVHLGHAGIGSAQLAPLQLLQQPRSHSIPSFQAQMTAFSPADQWAQASPFTQLLQPQLGQASTGHLAGGLTAGDSPLAAPAESTFSVQPPLATQRTASKRANMPQDLAAKRERHRLNVMQSGPVASDAQRARALTEGVCMNHIRHQLGTRQHDCRSEEDCRFAHFSIDDLLSYGYPKATIESAAAAVSRPKGGLK